MAATTKTRKRERGPRISAEERRDIVVDVAIDEFAIRGFHGTPTQDIAERAGISHAYLFRLFPTKTDLFIAVVDRCFERVINAFGAAMESTEPGEKLEAMGGTYIGLLDDRTKLLSQVQAWAACDDAEIRKAVQRGWETLYTFVKSESGASTDEVREFFAMGMLLTVAATVDLFSLDPKWRQRLLPADKH